MVEGASCAPWAGRPWSPDLVEVAGCLDQVAAWGCGLNRANRPRHLCKWNPDRGRKHGGVWSQCSREEPPYAADRGARVQPVDF